jgi:hypothetical protein
MLLAAWGATMGRPAFITSAVFDILGSAPRSFRQWVADHAAAFMEGPTPHSNIPASMQFLRGNCIERFQRNHP